MLKQDIIDTLSVRAGQSKAECEWVFNSLCITIAHAMTDGHDVVLPGVGKLKAVTSPARRGRHPQTGAQIEVPACRKVRFVTAAELKRRMNGGGA